MGTEGCVWLLENDTSLAPADSPATRASNCRKLGRMRPDGSPHPSQVNSKCSLGWRIYVGSRSTLEVMSSGDGEVCGLERDPLVRVSPFIIRFIFFMEGWLSVYHDFVFFCVYFYQEISPTSSCKLKVLLFRFLPLFFSIPLSLGFRFSLSFFPSFFLSFFLLSILLVRLGGRTGVRYVGIWLRDWWRLLERLESSGKSLFL